MKGPLPGIRPVCLMIGTPTPWTDWLKARGFEVPADIRFAYGYRADGPDYEDGAAHPKPLKYPAEFDDTAFLVGQTIDYIKSAHGPFVAHLSLLRPHPPFVAPEPYNSMYDPARVPGFTRLATPEEEARQHPWLAHQLTRRIFRATDNEKRLRRLKAVYYGLMSRVDAEIGRLVRFLKESGRWDSTFIIFTSDHGEQIGDHWLIGKCGYFDGSYHIPLIVRDPRPQADAERGAVSFGLHRKRRYHADDAAKRSAPKFQCNATGYHSRRSSKARAAPTNGGAKRIGSSTSAIPPTTPRSARSASRCINAR